MNGNRSSEKGEIIGETRVTPITRRDMPERRLLSPLGQLKAHMPVRTPRDLDRVLHAWQSRFTGGLSPGAFSLSFFDWMLHALNSPFEMAEMSHKALMQFEKLMLIAMKAEQPAKPRPEDHRFSYAGWNRMPFDLLVQATLLGEQWLEDVVHTPNGVQKSSESMMSFSARQWLNTISPSNFPWLNPQVIDKTLSSGGKNLVHGTLQFLSDNLARHSGKTQSKYKIGIDIASTPGKVIYRNKLIELIQYAPSTPSVDSEPVLIVPAWIMKYYILDLSPHNSLIRWLVSQGRTVFCISWKNPGAEFRDVTFEDYRKLGVLSALNVISDICLDRKIHAVGYCLGGTLLAVQCAVMAREQDKRLASLSLFAAETDFSDAGELQLFISEDQLSFLNDMMQVQGYLSSAQMAGAFQMLRSNDLIWQPVINKYWLGERGTMNDLMAWNADGTRMPACMHNQYLHALFLNDDLAEGRFHINGSTVALQDIRLPVFVVGTERDHIAPWRSVFKIHYLNDSEITFILTSGGHNAGIVSEPGHRNRYFRLRMRPESGRTLGPDEWVDNTQPQNGSWWVAWKEWLDNHSEGPRIDPPSMGTRDLAPLCEAPGTYVLEK